MRSAIAVEFRIGSWMPSLPANKRRPKPEPTGRGRNADHLRWWIQRSVDRTVAVLDTGVFDHDNRMAATLGETGQKGCDVRVHRFGRVVTDSR
jgi:hypothetical protein